MRYDKLNYHFPQIVEAVKGVRWSVSGVEKDKVLTRYASIMYRICYAGTIHLRATRTNAELISVKSLLILKMSSRPVNSVI